MEDKRQTLTREQMDVGGVEMVVEGKLRVRGWRGEEEVEVSRAKRKAMMAQCPRAADEKIRAACQVSRDCIHKQSPCTRGCSDRSGAGAEGLGCWAWHARSTQFSLLSLLSAAVARVQPPPLLSPSTTHPSPPTFSTLLPLLLLPPSRACCCNPLLFFL